MLKVIAKGILYANNRKRDIFVRSLVVRVNATLGYNYIQNTNVRVCIRNENFIVLRVII